MKINLSENSAFTTYNILTNDLHLDLFAKMRLDSDYLKYCCTISLFFQAVDRLKVFLRKLSGPFMYYCIRFCHLYLKTDVHTMCVNGDPLQTQWVIFINTLKP